MEDFLSAYKYDENESYLRIFGIQMDIQVYSDILNLNTYIADNKIGKVTITSVPETEINLDGNYEEVYEDLTITLKIDKNIEIGLFFLSPKGIEKYLQSDQALKNEKIVKIAYSGFEEFNTLYAKFVNFSNTEMAEINNVTLVETIKYVKPLTIEAQKRLPYNILSWVVEEDIASRIPINWKNSFYWRLFTSLSTEVYELGNLLELTFRGERRRKIIFNIQESYLTDTIYTQLNSCCNWLYYQSKDVDSRHSIFNNQMSIVLLEDNVIAKIDDIAKILENALENSKLAYRYYLQTSSKELAKNLTDLNKTLFDYISKIRQNTTDLINSLWKDFTTVLALLMLTFSQKKADLPSYIFDYLGTALAIYLVVSIFLNSRINFWFYKSIKDNLLSWQPKVYGYMSNDEFNAYALTPLAVAHKKYRSTFFITLGCYIVMIASLLMLTYEVSLSSIIK